MKVIDDVLLKKDSVTSGYVVSILFDDGFSYTFPLSNEFSSFGSHPSWVAFCTQSGFVSRPHLVDGYSSLPFKYDSLGNLLLKLPTCCGYSSHRGKWLISGSFHRYCIVSIDDLISSL